MDITVMECHFEDRIKFALFLVGNKETKNEKRLCK